MSLILELTYNKSLITTALQNLVIFHIAVALVSLGISSVAGFIITRRLSKPIQSIVHDVDTISKGDLDHSISPPFGKEFLILEQSLVTMVGTLRKTIQQLQNSEKDLKRSQERYQAVIESQNELIFRFTPDGTHIFVNDAYCRYFGMRCEELIGTKFIPNIPFDDRERIHRHFSSLTQEHPTATIEIRIIMDDGSVRWQQWNNTAIFDTAGTLIEYQSVGRDITERKRAEDELKELYAEMEQRVASRTEELANANRELESFSYSVSHDLRAPLRAIDGYSKILLEEYGEQCSEGVRRYLELVRKSTRRMAELIDALLDFSRLGREALKPQQLMPADIVRNVLEELAPEMAGRDVSVTIGDLPPCIADPSMLKLVYNNLLSNALKFTRKREHAKIDIGSSSKNHHTVYFIRDNGVGFDMQYKDKLFTVFQRLHPLIDYEGTGVGLAIVQRIIQRHGGRIWVESVIDQGTTFFFTLDEEL